MTTVAPELKKTALNSTHRALKAKMVDFGGWDMPVEYPGPGGGLIAEHLAVRTAVGLFDVSHMGEIQFRGPGALAAVQHITMNDASRLKDGQAHYSALLTPQGTFVDDILVHRLSTNDYLLVVNAGTKDKDYAWIRQQVGSFPSIHISDYSSYYSQLALQGPKALATLQKLTKTDLAAIKNYWFTFGAVAGVPNVLIARTGYSGEDGFEVYLPADEPTTVKVWNELLAAGVAGDEVRRTQRGNNNAYCQDNPISWFDWTLVETNADLLRFVQALIAFRKSQPTLQHPDFMKGYSRADGQLPDVSWFNADGGPVNWGRKTNTAWFA